jgi:two-component system LytT family response regulator
MPAVNGTDLIGALKRPPAFIFTTAYTEFAVLSYELHAVDYLLKPITYERFMKGINRFLQQQPATVPVPEKEQVYIKVNGNLIKLFFRDILFAQSLKDYIKITTVSGSYLTHLTMRSLLGLLPQGVFKRIHRSYVINSCHIDMIGKSSVWIGKTEIPIGDNYRLNIQVL